MKTLRKTKNKQLNRDEEKVEPLIRHHFVWNEEERLTEEQAEEGKTERVEAGSLQGMMRRVETALSGIQNSSAPGPGGISYRFIKAIKDTTLVDRILEVVAKNLIKGTIPSE